MSTIVEKKDIKASAEVKSQLKEANRLYTECISREFLGRFLAGEKVSIDNFCVSERSKMTELDSQVYGKPLQL